MNLIRFLIGCCILLIVFSPRQIHAQEWPSSLHWRISGRGLSSPSYLYGSMHLADRRIFFLGDSLYASMDQCAGFAMELNPDEMIDSLIDLKKQNSGLLLKDFLSAEDFARLKPFLRDQLRVDPETITRRQFKAARDSAMYSLSKPDDMQAPLDLYLFDIARRKGKWVGGIEDISDQSSFLDEPGFKLDMDEIMEVFDERKRRQNVEKMIKVYLQQDLSAIHQMNPDDKEDIRLNRRNDKMARRIDSITKIRSCLFVTGAAHLPGDSGLIRLLRARGFTVEPVFSSRKIDPAHYRFEEKDTWITVNDPDSIYTVRMPNKPADLDLNVPGMKGQMSFELARKRVFFVAAIHMYQLDTAQLMQNIKKVMREKGQVITAEKKYTEYGFQGVEMQAVQDKFFYRLIMLPVNQSVFMLMTAAPATAELYDQEAEKFLASFRLTGKQPLAPIRIWEQYADSAKAFSAAFPKAPDVNALSGVEDTEDFSSKSFSALDTVNSIFLIVYVSDTKQGYMITSDSLIFQSKLEYYKEKGYPVEGLRYYSWNGYPAMEFRSAKATDDGPVISQLKVIIRQNRTYTVAAITGENKAGHPEVKRFFDSFQLLPYQQSGWTSQTSACGRFSTWSPSRILLQPADSATKVWDDTSQCRGRDCTYDVFDSAAATTLNISVTPASRYFWTDNDSTYFAALCSEYYTDTASEAALAAPGQFDSLIYMQPVSNGFANGYELLVKNASKTFFKRVRLLRSGDHAYRLYGMGSREYLHSAQVDRFFRDFRIMDTAATTTLFTRKVSRILEDMLSGDSATYAAAEEAFGDTRFVAEDFSALKQAFHRAADTVSTEHTTLAARITFALEELDTAGIRRMAAEAYPQLPGTSAKKMLLLQLLASNRNTASARLLTEYMLQSPPRAGTPYRMYYWLGDSLAICREQIPTLARLYTDSLLGPGLIYLTVKLIDSGRLGRDFLKQEAQAIREAAAARLRTLQSSGADNYLYSDDLIRALDLLGDKGSIQLLHAFRQQEITELKELATLALLRNRQPLQLAEIRKVAAPPANRVWFYNQLRKEGLQRFFPRDLLQQKSFAECYIIHHAASADQVEMEDARFSLLGERRAFVNGRQQRFYIFRIHFISGEEQSTCIAVCGGFDPAGQQMLLKDEHYAVGIYYEDMLPTDLNAIFKRFSADYLQPVEK